MASIYSMWPGACGSGQWGGGAARASGEGGAAALAIGAEQQQLGQRGRSGGAAGSWRKWGVTSDEGLGILRHLDLLGHDRVSMSGGQGRSSVVTVGAAATPPPPSKYNFSYKSELECNNSGDEDAWNNLLTLANVSQQGNVLPDTSQEIEDAPAARSDHELCHREPKNHRLSALGQEMGTNQEPKQHVETTHDINTSVADKGKGKTKDDCCAYVLSVASEASNNNHDNQAEEEQLLTESQLQEMMIILEGHVSAWEAELNSADGGCSILEETTVHEGETVDEAEDQGRSEVTKARLQEEIFVCEQRLDKAQSKISDASETEKHLHVEAWKHCAAEAKRQIHAASVVETQLRDELATWKRRATEAEASHRAEIKASQEKAAEAMTCLQAEISKRDQKFMEYKTRMEDKICALVGYYTTIQTGLGAMIDGSDDMIKYYQKEVQTLRDKISDMEQHGVEQRVSGHEHADLAPSHGQASGQ
ncbi:hypothetical protein HU200_034133 [Digitaria exilis]|uniref:Uncharacterized protein n=1 Tax=Digitaria exilis TaxID=1010633 RepID=A0A835EQS7_9POAL|nr:hypothetical protein HU200_034133 [Digitaria exilis]